MRVLHETWEALFALVHDVANRFDGVVYDPRAGRRWDAGQAVCAEAFGADWSASPEWHEMNQIAIDQPCPQYMIDAAQRVAHGDAVERWAIEAEAAAPR